MKKIVLLILFILVSLKGFSQTRVTLHLPSPCEATNVNDSKLKSIKIIPNPNNGQFFIRLQDQSGINEMIISVYSMDGKLVFTKKLESHRGDIKINAGELKSGVYCIQLKGKDTVFKGKLLIKK